MSSKSFFIVFCSIWCLQGLSHAWYWQAHSSLWTIRMSLVTFAQVTMSISFLLSHFFGRHSLFQVPNRVYPAISRVIYRMDPVWKSYLKCLIIYDKFATTGAFWNSRSHIHRHWGITYLSSFFSSFLLFFPLLSPPSHEEFILGEWTPTMKHLALQDELKAFFFWLKHLLKAML